jgi:RNA polymerase sigma-70 factor (ECF subfamily)
MMKVGPAAELARRSAVGARELFGSGVRLMSVDGDEQLIDATLAGNTAAFGELVIKYQGRLLHSMTHVIGSAEDADDVVQDAFVQAFLKLETFQRTAAFYTWLYRIAVNAAISQQRRRRPSPSLDRWRETTNEEPHDRGPGPDGRMQQQERAAQVQAALARLPQEQRVVLVLREMEGCCYETIAEVLELPVGTVRSRLHRARLQLRDELKPVLQEDRAAAE